MNLPAPSADIVTAAAAAASAAAPLPVDNIASAQVALKQAVGEAPKEDRVSVSKQQRYSVRVGLCKALQVHYGHFYKPGKRRNDFVIHAGNPDGSRGAQVARAWPALRSYAADPINAAMIDGCLEHCKEEAWVVDFKFVLESYKFFNNERALMKARQEAREAERRSRAPRVDDDAATALWRQFRPAARKRKAVKSFIEESADAMEEATRRRMAILAIRKQQQRERERVKKEEEKAAAKLAKRAKKEEAQIAQFFVGEDKRIVKLEKRIGAQYGAQRCAFGDGAQGSDPPSKFGPSAATVGGSWLLAASKREAPNDARATRSETRRWREAAPAALRSVRDMPEIVGIASFLWCAAPALQIPVDLVALGALERALATVHSDSAPAPAPSGGAGRDASTADGAPSSSSSIPPSPSAGAPSVGTSAATVAGAALSSGGVASDGVLGGNLLDLVMTRLMCSATSIGRFASEETECVALPYAWWNARLVALVDDWYERRRVVDEAVASYFVLRRSWRDVGAATAARAEAAAAKEAEAASRPPTPAAPAEPGAAVDAASGAAAKAAEEAADAHLAGGASDAGAADAPAPVKLSPSDAADRSAAAHARWESTGVSSRGHVVAVQHGSKKYDCVVTLVVVPGRRYRVWCVTALSPSPAAASSARPAMNAHAITRWCAAPATFPLHCPHHPPMQVPKR
jgi:hypothetical protein